MQGQAMRCALCRCAQAALRGAQEYCQLYFRRSDVPAVRTLFQGCTSVWRSEDARVGHEINSAMLVTGQQEQTCLLPSLLRASSASMTAPLPLLFKRCRPRQDMARKRLLHGVWLLHYLNRHCGHSQNCDKTERQTECGTSRVRGKCKMTQDLKR